jgi:hypothetical protein
MPLEKDILFIFPFINIRMVLVAVVAAKLTVVGRHAQ